MESTDTFAMLQSLKVQELQQILSYANQQRVGKKLDLIKRCTKLLDHPSFNVEEKIKEVYSRRHPGSEGYPKPILPAQPVSSNVPICPDVQFVQLAFYEHLAELMRPMSLCCTNEKFTMQRGTAKSTHFVFHLSPQEAQDVATSREFMQQLQRYEYSVQVQLRFCALPTSSGSGPCEDKLPPNLSIVVNGRTPTLPPPKPTSKPNAEIIRPGRPIDISALCRLSPTIANRVDIAWTIPTDVNAPQNYCVGVYLVRKVSVDTLLRRLRQNCTRHADFTRAMIKEKLSPSNSGELLEITTNTLHASLYCPLSKWRMQVPGRSKACKHIQCFDIEAFLRMNEKKPTWICPVCDIKTPYDSLMIDGLFLEILSKYDYNMKELEFDSQANYKPQAHTTCSKSNVKSEESLKGDSGSGLIVVDNSVVVDSPKRKHNVEVIVLSSDESENEEPSELKNNATNRNTAKIPAQQPQQSNSMTPTISPQQQLSQTEVVFSTHHHHHTDQVQLNRPKVPLSVKCSPLIVPNTTFTLTSATTSDKRVWEDDIITLD